MPELDGMNRSASWRELFLCMIVGLAVLAAGGCRTSETPACGAGVCPPGTVCAGDGLECVEVEFVEACGNVSDGEDCFIGRQRNGTCRSGVCRLWRCGNGQLEPGEVCDDGNEAAGDGCGARCLSDESCGNGVVDAATGEECDCGTDADAGSCGEANADVPGARCRLNCRLAHCGDAVVDSDEDCEPGHVSQMCVDVGYYGGELSCTRTCEFDESQCAGFCGDGELNGPESCDGATFARDCVALGFDMGVPACAECSTDPSPCERLGWQPFPGPDRPNAIWVRDGLGYATSSLGDLYRLRDGVWKFLWRASSPRGLWVRGEDDVYIAGTGLFHYDGSLIHTEVAAVELYDVWGEEPEFGVAVGDGVILEFDGERWGRAWEAKGVLLESVSGFAGDVWAVGNAIVRRTADGWHIVPPPVQARFTSVWARNSREVYVGTTADGVWRWDGDAWRQEPLLPSTSFSEIGGNDERVFALSGDAGLFVDAGSGFRREDVGVDYRPATMHVDSKGAWLARRDGKRLYRRSEVGAWATRPMAPYAGKAWADALDNIYFTRNFGWVNRFDGVRMTLVDTNDTITDISGTPEGIAVLAGHEGVYEYDGVALRRVWTYLQSFESIWAEGGTEIVGVVPPEFVPLGTSTTGSFVHYDRHAGTVREFHLPEGYQASTVQLGGTSDDNIYASGKFKSDRAVVFHFDGTAWTPIELDTANRLRSLFVAPDGVVFAVGDAGTVVRFDGDLWHVTTIGEERLLHVFGSSSSDVFALGADGGLYRFDGIEWGRIRRETKSRFMPVFASAARVAFYEVDEGLLYLDRARIEPAEAKRSLNVRDRARERVSP